MPRKKNPNNQYWNQAVEDAVCGYNSTTTQAEREKHYKIKTDCDVNINKVIENLGNIIKDE